VGKPYLAQALELIQGMGFTLDKGLGFFQATSPGGRHHESTGLFNTMFRVSSKSFDQGEGLKNTK
jgi:hypothetical protein